MFIRCIDVETLGLEPGDGVCEIGFCDVHQRDGKWIPDAAPWSVLVNPGKSIPATASAIHHLMDIDVADAPRLEEAIANSDLIRDDAIYCAHVARFERAHLPMMAALQWLDTWKIAIFHAPNAPGHSLQCLRYWSKLEVDRDIASPPHRAGPDTLICAHLIARMLNKHPMEELLAISNRPAILPVFTFGKHAMQPLETVPSSYLSWMLNQTGDAAFDEDQRATCLHHLNLRRAKS